eukprot:5948524-Heterocapsa_arctica.AAC.1
MAEEAAVESRAHRLRLGLRLRLLLRSTPGRRAQPAMSGVVARLPQVLQTPARAVLPAPFPPGRWP